MKKIAVLLIITFALLTTCKKDVYNPDICFQENVLPIFVSNCSMGDCHNSQHHKEGLDLTNYDGIMKGVKANHPMLSKVYTTIRGNNPSMPTGGIPKLGTREVNIIKTWINMGAPNSSNCKGCDTTQFAFNARIKPLMDNWCVGCHSATNSGGGYDLSSYNGVVASVTANRLLGTLQHAAGYSPMPKNTSPLSDCDITAVRKWIEAGHPNN